MTAACRVVKAIGLIWLHIDSAVSWLRRCNIAYQRWQKTDMASEPSCSVKLLTFTVRVSQGLTGCWTQSFLHFNGLYQAFLQDILCQYWFPESIYSYCHICQVFFLSALQELFAPIQVCVQFIYFHSAKHQTLYIATIKQCNSGQLTQLTQQTNNAVKVPRNHNDVRFNDIGYIHFYITERTHPSPKVSLFSFI